MKRTKSKWQLRGYGLVAALSVSLLTCAAAFGQTPGSVPEEPMSVLLFPAQLDPSAVDAAPGAPAAAPAAGAASAAAPAVNPRTKMIQDIATEALRKSLAKSGVFVVLYDKRLPSIQRAISETTLQPDEVAGPGDDPVRARKLAEIVGATEYIMPAIDSYKYDAATRTATINLSVTRTSVTDGITLGTAAAPGTGVSAADVAAPRQEGAALARSAEVAAEQATQGLFPRAPVEDKKGKKKDTKKAETRSSNPGSWFFPAAFAITGVIIANN